MTSQRPYRKFVQPDSFHIHVNPAIAEARNQIIQNISMPTLQKSILATGKMSPEISKAMQTLGELAVKVVVERDAQMKKLLVTKGSSGTKPGTGGVTATSSGCSKYNTVWNAILSIAGMCSDWDVCMYDQMEEFNKKMKEIVDDYEPGANPYADCAP